MKQILEPVVKRKFWMEAYLAFARAGSSHSLAKANADGALVSMRERFEIVEPPKLRKSDD